MQVILPDEQIHQLQLLISRLIENEIKNKLFELKVAEQPSFKENQVKPETINQRICR